MQILGSYWSRLAPNNLLDYAGFGLMINAEALMSYLGGKIYETLRNQILEFQREVKLAIQI